MNLYWTLWFLLGFGVPEGIGLLSGHPEWTFSAFVWRTFGVQSQWNPTHWHFGQYLIVVATVWLVGHFGFKIWRG